MKMLDRMNEVRQLYADDNAEGFVKLLEEWGYSDGKYVCHSPIYKARLCLYLGLGAAVVDSIGLSEEAADAIIDHVYGVVDPFTMLSLIVQHKKIKKPNYNHIPMNIRKALKEDVYSESVKEQIAGLSDEVTKAVMFYVVNEIETIKTKYVAPLLKAGFRMIDKGLFFAFLSLSLEEPKNGPLTIGIVIGGDGKNAPINCEIIPVLIDLSEVDKNGQKPEKAEEEPADESKEEDDSTQA